MSLPPAASEELWPPLDGCCAGVAVLLLSVCLAPLRLLAGGDVVFAAGPEDVLLRRGKEAARELAPPADPAALPVNCAGIAARHKGQRAFRLHFVH